MSTQEFLVERCLDDEQQLLDALAPGPLLDTDLLTLDDNTLKSQLTDIGDPTGTIVSQASDIFVPLSKDDKIEDCENAKTEELRRSKRHGENAGIDDNWSKFIFLIFSLFHRSTYGKYLQCLACTAYLTNPFSLGRELLYQKHI